MANKIRRRQISLQKVIAVKNRMSKPKLNAQIPTDEKSNEQKTIVDMKDLEVKIKSIAK